MAGQAVAERIVVEVAGERVCLEGRAAAMVVYLARNIGRVNAGQKGHVAFDFCEREISPRVHAIDTSILW